MAVNIGPKIGITGEAEYRNQINNIITQAKTLDSEMKKVSSSFDKNASSSQKSAAQAKVLTEQIKVQEERVKLLNQMLEKSVQEKGKDANATLRWQQAVNNAQTELNNMNNKLKELDAPLDEFSEGMEEAGSAVDAASSLFIAQQIAEKAKEIAAAFMECAEQAEVFETSMTKVSTIANQSDAFMSQMSDQTRQAAKEYGISAKDFAEASYQAISASVDAGDAVEFTGKATKLAIGGFTDSASAVDVLTTAINAYGLSAADADHIMDDLVTTQNLGKTTVNELAQSLGTVIPTASAYGVSLDQLSSTYVTLTRNGIKTAEATTYISGMLTELADSGSQVGEILQEETGQSFGQLMKSGKSLGDVIQILGDSVDGDAEAFANLWGNVRAGRGALSIFNSGADEFNETLGLMGQNAGTAEKAFEQMAGSSEMMKNRFNASMEDMQIAIGDALLPALDGMYESGIKVADGITQIVEVNPELVAGVAATTAAVVGLTGALTAYAAIKKAVLALDLVNPMNAAIIGAGALAAGILAVTVASEEAYTSIGELHAEFEKGSQSYQEETGELKASSEEFEKLAKTVTTLSKKENLNETEKLKLIAAVSRLNELMPELNLQYDENTGKLTGNTEALEQNLEAAVKAYKAKKNQEELLKITEREIELEDQLAEAEKRVAEARASYTEARDRGDLNYAAGEKEAYEDALAYEAEIKASQEELAHQYEETSGKVKEYTDSVSESSTQEAENVGATQQANDALTVYNQTLADLSVKSMEALTSQQQLFTGIKESSKVTTAEVADNMAAQKAQMHDYYMALADVNKQIMSSNDESERAFLRSLAEYGPEYASSIQEIVDSAKSGSEEYQQAVADFANVQTYDALASNLDAHIQLSETAIQNGADAVEQATTAGNEQILSQQEQAQAAQEQSAVNHANTMKTAATNTMTGMAQAAQAGGAQMTATFQQVGTQTIQALSNALGIYGSGASMYTRQMGFALDQGLVEGIRAGQSLVISAATQVATEAIQAAKQALDVHSPSKKFKWLGEMVDEGFALGVKGNAGVVDRAVNQTFVTPPLSAYATTNNTSNSNTTNLGGVSINVYGAEGQDIDSLANEIETRLYDSYSSRRAAYG